MNGPGDRRLRKLTIGRAEETQIADARAKAHKMRLLLREGGDPAVEVARLAEVPTFGSFVLDRYLPFARTRKRSWKADESMLRHHLLPRFGAFRLDRIPRADIVAMHQDARAKGYAPGTCNRILVLMNFIFNCAIRWDLLPGEGNPCRGVEPFENTRARERFLTHEEVSRLCEALDLCPNLQAAQIIRLLLLTGARKREIMDARWEHIDFARSLLLVPVSKSGKPRHVALSDAAIKVVRSVDRREDVPWVFYNPDTLAPFVSIFCSWDTIRKRAGLPDVRLHDLRHSFASFLVSSGRSLYEVQKLLGHHDPKMTIRYAHLAPGTLVEAANLVGDMVGAARRTGGGAPG